MIEWNFVGRAAPCQTICADLGRPLEKSGLWHTCRQEFQPDTEAAMLQAVCCWSGLRFIGSAAGGWVAVISK